MAHINNLREKHSLETKTKYYDKCRENSASLYNRREKELKHHLRDLQREKHHLQQGGSCLDENSESYLETHSGHNSGIRQNQGSSHNQITAHDVALKILGPQQPHYSIRQDKNKPGHGSEKDEYTHRKQQSWHGRTNNVNLPNINDRPRRHSIADPAPTKRIAWNENEKNSRPPSSKVRNSEDKVLKMSQPNIVIISPGNSTSSLNKETILKVEDFHQEVPYRYQLGRKNSKHDSHASTSSQMPASNSGHKRAIDQESLQHYYAILAENERLLREENRDFEMPADVHCPIQTIRRSNKRKLLALESLLMQLPSFKNKGPEMDPISCLNCRYLRLSKQNIIDLENECLASGRDPGVHAHMDEERVLEYYENEGKGHSGISLSSRRASIK